MPFVPKPPDDGERASLACYRISELPKPHVAAVERDCSKCGEPVWVSLSSFSILEKPNAEIVCMQCAQTDIQAHLANGDEPPHLGTPTREQIADVLRYYLDLDGRN